MKENVIAIVQARYGSSRLPGKVTLPLSGHSVLWHIHQRLSQVPEIDEIVFATTSQEEDHPVCDEVSSWGGSLFAYSGDVNNLLDRYISCGDKFNADIIVMVDGDCPLLHPETVSRMVQSLQENSNLDYSKLSSESIEGGVAVLRLSAYRKIESFLGKRVQRDKRSSYREHATLCIMENPDWFSIAHVDCFPEFKGVKHRLWLDTPADYDFLKKVYSQLYSDDGGIVSLIDVVSLLNDYPDIKKINAHVGQKNPLATGDKILLKGGGDEADALSHELTSHYGLAILRGASEISPETTIFEYVDSNEDYSITHSEGNIIIQIGISNPRPIKEVAALIAQTMGASQLKSGYFDVDARSDDLVEVNCPVCGGDANQDLWLGPTGVVNAICERCSHVFLRKRPSQKKLAENYQAYVQSYPIDWRLRTDTPFGEIAKIRAKRARSLFKQNTKTVSALELGCGDGYFLNELPDSWGKIGIEPSRSQADFVRKYRNTDEIWGCGFENFNVRPPTWPEEGFDLIASFHVMEHVEDPPEFLKFAHENLSDQGYFLLAVPDLIKLSADLIEFHYLAHGFHLHSFHTHSLNTLAEQNGFEIHCIETEAQTPALKSSLLAVLKKSDTVTNSTHYSFDNYSLSAGKEFHAILSSNVDKLLENFKKWRAEELKIAIFGAGVHTESLLLAAPDAIHSVAFIVDDDPEKCGSILAGKTVMSRKAIHPKTVDIVLVSSLSAEDRILDFLGQDLDEKIKIVGVYRDIFDKNE